MAQAVGEMFVNLGVKGADKTIGALGDTAKGISTLGSMSIEAKAAIVGVFYALEQMFAATGQQGVSLTNMKTLTGMNTKTLQEYEFALRQVGGTAAEMDSTFKGLQNSITNMIFGKGAPERLLAVVSELKKAGIQVGNEEQLEWAKHPEKLLLRLQEYAKLKNVPLFEKTNFLKSFGLDDTVIAGLEKGIFNPKTFAQAKQSIYSEDTIGKLNASAIAWSNVADRFEHAFGLITAEYGKSLADDFGKLVDPIVSLTKAIIGLSQAMHLLEGIGKIFEGWADLLDILHGKMPSPKVNEKLENTVLDTVLMMPGGGAALKETAGKLYDSIGAFFEAAAQRREAARAPAGSIGLTPAQIALNQHFYGPADPRKVQDASKKGIEDAQRTSPNQNKP